jgi:hypothetical protein
MIPWTRSTSARSFVFALALSSTAVSAQQTRPSQRPNTAAGLGIHGFSVVLVVGSLASTAGAPSDGVPEVARKALADMKDFLPYKRYQLLDAAWMMCCPPMTQAYSGRVRGPDDREYRYSVDPLTVADGKLNLRFSVREIAAPATAAAARNKAKESLTRNHPQMVEPARRSAQMQGMANQNIIDSNFAIALNETVVVGTSRLNGDRALIAILTAAGKPAAQRER